MAGTTTFVDNDSTVSASTRSSNPLVSLGPSSHDENSIANFMAKPVLVWSGPFSTQYFGQDVFQANIADLLMAQTMWTNKLSGYRLFRGTAVLKLVVNADPFSAGRLILHVLPCVKLNDLRMHSLHNMSMTQVTQHPNVELDMRETSAEMRVPYLTPVSHFDIQEFKLSAFPDRYYDWGCVHISVLSPLAQGTSASQYVDCSLFLSFEDVSLSAPMLLQSGKGLSGHGFRNKPIVSSDMERETKNASTGFLTKAVGIGKQVNNALGAVPGWSAVSSVADSVLDIGGSIASIFGWSKPIDLNKVTIVSSQPARYMPNSAGYAESDVLAMDPIGQVALVPNFAGSNSDEMNFNFLKGIPVWIESFKIQTSMIQDTLVYSQQVSPLQQVTIVNVTGTGQNLNLNTFGPLAMFAQFFSLWRGGITLTFKFVKTDFHSCRLLFAFVPGDVSTISIPDSAYVLREIVDIRTDSEFTMTLPYLKPQEYLPVSSSGDLFDGNISGTLIVKVLNPLKCPDTAPNYIDCLVYMSGAPDYDVALLDSSRLPQVFSLECGMNLEVGKTTVDEPIANATKSNSGSNEYCIGDQFFSLKQLLNITAPMPTSLTFNTTTNFGMFPHALQISKGNASQTAVSHSAFYTDFVSFISLSYIFSRGGMAVRAFMTTNPTNTFAYTMSKVRGPTEPRLWTATRKLMATPSETSEYSEFAPLAAQNIGHSTVSAISSRGVMDVIVPHSGATPLRINRPEYFVLGTAPINYIDTPNVSVRVQSGVSNPLFFRRGGDDYVCGLFIGCPTVVFSTDTPAMQQKAPHQYVVAGTIANSLDREEKQQYELVDRVLTQT